MTQTLLAFDRETLMVAALAALIVAGLVVSVGAAILLRHDRQAERPSEHQPESPD